MVGCFRFNGPLRQYFSLYRAVSQREGEREEKGQMRVKMSKTTPTRTYCKRSRPLPYCYQNCRTPRHWKFTQHLRTTRPPPTFGNEGGILNVIVLIPDHCLSIYFDSCSGFIKFLRFFQQSLGPLLLFSLLSASLPVVCILDLRITFVTSLLTRL